jgi:ABC-type uncharacterized transport system involved in gliding motility auxiliary subunit
MLKRIASIAGWLGTALVFGAVAVRFLRPEWERYAYWGAWAGLVCVLIYSLAQWRDVAAMFGRRQARLGAMTVASVLIVLGILTGLNYIGSRQNKRWDLTSSKQFSLSDQTRKVLEGLDSPLAIHVFDKTDEFDRFRDRLKEYEYVSKRVAVDYNDVDRKPAVARQYQVQAYGTVVFEYKGRTERVTSDSEQELTNAVIKIVSGQQKKVYFVQGHGEKDTASSERTGYNTISQALGRENYTVDKLVLAQQKDVPADASVVVLAGPRTDLFPQEVDALRAYLKTGGKLLVMIDPPDAPDAPPFTNLIALVRDWGFEVGTNVVVDASGMGQLIGTDASVPVAASYPSHPITTNFNFLTAFPLARSVAAVSGGVNGRTPQSFVETSARSWAETDIGTLLKTGKVGMDVAKGDKQGPVGIAAAVSAAAETAAPAGDKPAENKENADKKPETRVVVFGDSDFAANFALNIQGNRDLLLNTIGWLAQQENLIAIRPREPDDRRVTLTADQQTRITWLALLIIPGAIVGSGVYGWWRRR